MPNRLAQESSPYLLQHAHNPVNWYPWGEEAFAAARTQDKPILLSVGYAACHWCHVMAHESFEDPATAAIMNEHFINVKVDREERPDVDQIYMNAVVALTQQGGWPLTAVLTPDGEPFFGGTYFPKTPRYGMPSFQQVLLSLAKAWREQRSKVNESAADITNHISNTYVLAGQAGVLSKGLLDRALQQYGAAYDKRWGGFGGAPKFPQPMNLEFVLRGAKATADPNVLAMATHTLEMMARGGIYDHIGGGFARYSVDEKWLVPHFEKMLYDNAQLGRVYLHAWQMTGNPLFRRITEQTLDYVLREMTHVEGGFYSSQDADSEGEEGKFYIWHLGEIEAILGAAKAAVFAAAYDITPSGNWEGKNIPNLKRPLAETAVELGKDAAALEAELAPMREKLYSVRAKRVWPGLDDKVLTAWNGLMLAAFAEAGRVFKREDYVQAAVASANFLYTTMRQPNGRLLRTWKAGTGAKYNGYLEDYAFLAEGLLALYQTTFEERWFMWAQELADLMVAHFADENGGFFDTSDDHEALIFRPKDVQDNAIPSGNAMAATVLLKLSLYTGEGNYWDRAEQAVSAMYGAMAQYPTGFGQWLNTATLILNEAQEIAVIGSTDAADTRAMLDVIFEGYRPYQVVAVGIGETAVPLLADRPQRDGRATAYVCRRFVCQAPTTDPIELAAQLG